MSNSKYGILKFYVVHKVTRGNIPKKDAHRAVKVTCICMVRAKTQIIYLVSGNVLPNQLTTS